MYSYLPALEKKKEKIIAVVSTVVSFSVFYFGRLDRLPAPALFELLGLALMVLPVLLVSNCILKNYRYEIDENGIYTVTELTRKRQTIVCRLALSDITYFGEYSKEKVKQLHPKQGFNYTGAYFPGDSYIIVFDYGDCPTAVRVLCDERMAELLKKRVGEPMEEIAL